MSAPKIGDRVRVEFDGEVNGTHGDGTLRVTDEGDAFRVYAWVLPEHCTVIAPPIKVGDLIDLDNIHACPPGTIVARPGADPLTYKQNGRWWRAEPASDGVVYDSVVLRVGGGA